MYVDHQLNRRRESSLARWPRRRRTRWKSPPPRSAPPWPPPPRPSARRPPQSTRRARERGSRQVSNGQVAWLAWAALCLMDSKTRYLGLGLRDPASRVSCWSLRYMCREVSAQPKRFTFSVVIIILLETYIAHADSSVRLFSSYRGPARQSVKQAARSRPLSRTPRRLSTSRQRWAVCQVVLRVKRYHCWVSNETFIFYSNYHLPSGFRQQEVDGEQARRHRVSADDDSRPGGEVCRQHRALPCHRQRRSRHEVTL